MRLLRQVAQKLFKRRELIKYWSPFSNHTARELVIVTGADSSHFRSLNQFLSSLYNHEPNIRVVVYDLGLMEPERLHLRNSFPSADLRLFDYSQYPDYFNIKVNAGEYAWKPVIFSEIFNEFRCCICWMDAGNVVTEPLAWILRIAKKIGMYSPYSSGCISDWTHPKTLEFLNVPDRLLKMPNLNGACVAAYYHNPEARSLVNQWKTCALERDCIAPAGSSRQNHRQDQAVLSVLAHQSGITKKMPARSYGFKIHQDID